MSRTARQILEAYIRDNDIALPIEGSVRAFCRALAADHPQTASAFRHAYADMMDDREAEAPTASREPVVSVRRTGEGETLGTDDEGDWFDMDVEDRIYTFRIASTVFSMSFREIEDMIASYVHEGGGLTQVQVARQMWRRHRRKLTGDFVRRIFRVLGVVKHNPPLAPHTVRHEAPERAAEIWHEQKLAEIETRYRARRHGEIEKALKEEREKSLRFEDLAAEYLADQERKIITIGGGPWERDLSAESHTAIVVFSDWHVGKIFERVRSEVDFRACVDRLVDSLVDYFGVENKRPVERLIFAVAGDILDGTQGDMHEGQHLGQWALGRRQADIAAECLALVVEGLCVRLGVQGEVYAVTGNHDRTSKGRDGDPMRTVGGMMYLLAAERSPSAVWHIVDEPIARFEASGTGFLLVHGDQTPKDPRRLFHGLGGEYQAVISGHLHSHAVAEDYRGYWFQAGTLGGVDSYARRIGVGAEPSQMVISVREGRPPVSIRIAC